MSKQPQPGMHITCTHVIPAMAGAGGRELREENARVHLTYDVLNHSVPSLFGLSQPIYERIYISRKKNVIMNTFILFCYVYYFDFFGNKTYYRGKKFAPIVF